MNRAAALTLVEAIERTRGGRAARCLNNFGFSLLWAMVLSASRDFGQGGKVRHKVLKSADLLRLLP